MNIKEIEKRLDGHSIFSPSASKMWLTCPGSLIPNLLADNPTNHAAAEGTVAHGVAEEWLKSGRKPRHMIGKIETISDKLGNSFDIEITPEMIGYVQEYVDYVNSLDGEKHIEIRVDLSDFTPIENQGGTADCINFDGDVLRIVDFKYGQGVHVDAFENTQMQTYALGAHAKYGHLHDFKEVEMVIVQPRKENLSIWRIPIEQLFDFSDTFVDGAARAWKEDAPRVPTSDGCFWCKVNHNCGALAVMIEKDVTEIFASDIKDVKNRIADKEYPHMRDPNVLTVEEMESIYLKKGVVTRWFDSIEKRIFETLNGGTKMKFFKLVEKRKTRSWVNTEAGVAVLSEAGLKYEDIMPRKMLSPSEAEVALVASGMSKKEAILQIDAVINSRSSGVTFAPMTDKRPEFSGIDGVW